MDHHDPGDEAVGHANGHAVLFQGSTDLGRRIGARLAQSRPPSRVSLSSRNVRLTVQ
jgi:acyl-CoA reductase-like NAD-dependent aldehyde dehydrogenase